MDQLEQRVIRLELRVEDHAEELKKLQDISNDLRKSLTSIEKTLAQIKWLAMGAVVTVIGQSMGLDKAFRILMG